MNELLPGKAASVVVVSSNSKLRQSLLPGLATRYEIVSEAASGSEALEVIESQAPSTVLLDPALPDLRIEDFTDIMRSQFPQVQIIPMNSSADQPLLDSSSFSSVDHSGPGRFPVVRALRDTAADGGSMSLSGFRLVPQTGKDWLPGFVGEAQSIQRMCSMARIVAERDTTVLITGESGTGKDLVARAIHQLSPRSSKPFVVINCAAIPEALLEAELFGYVKGAFTGAVQSRIGRIHAAQGGTLFLDEIGDMPLGLQSKLLRFLEQGEIQRLGSGDTFRVDVRVVAATNAILRKLVQERAFREDLYYRLSVFPLEIPPMRQRMGDLRILVQHFLAKFGFQNLTFTPGAFALLQQHSWPGNVREIRNVVERAGILAGSEREIGQEHILI
jgi:DNA-binding NtrC family response regulator